MKRTKVIEIGKYTVYALLLLALYVLQTTPGLFVILGAKPLLVIPAAIAIAMVEGEFVGGIYGAFAGLLCDVTSTALFGFNGLMVALFCVAAGLMVIYLMHCNTGGAVLFVLITMLARGSLEYLFGYHIWGYESVGRLFTLRILPVALYTTAITPPIFWLIRRIYRRFQAALHPE